MTTNYDDALKFANEFCDKFDIKMNNRQMARFVNLLVAFRESAQQCVQSDGAVCTCQVNAADFHGNCMRCGLPTTPRH